MADEKCTVGSCCCGCTLKTGAWVTAIVCLIWGIVNTVLSVYGSIANKENSGWFNVISNVIMLLAAILLFVGVRQDKPRLIKIWVYTMIVVIILIIISTFVVFAQFYDISVLLSNLIFVAFIAYFIVVVRSYAIELESGGAASGNVA